jgi:hypothetical protein
VVTSQSARHERSDRVAENSRVAWCPPDPRGIDEAGGEGVTATGGVHHVDGKRRNLLSPFAADDQRSVGTAGDGEQPGAGIKQPAASVVKVCGPGEAEYLFLVAQQIVGVGHRRRDDVERPPAAVPAAVIRICSTNADSWPGGMSVTGRTSTSSMWAPIAMTFIGRRA